MRYEVTISAGGDGAAPSGVQVWRDGVDVTESVNLHVDNSDITSISFDVPKIFLPEAAGTRGPLPFNRPYMQGQPTTEEEVQELKTRVSELEAWRESERERRAGDDW